MEVAVLDIVVDGDALVVRDEFHVGLAACEREVTLGGHGWSF